MPPKVFISHASEDKDRFVLDFASRLRAQGIDAWLDRWEMLPGDSLVDKLFEKGLHSATAVVIVLSTNSVDKQWVREELNAAFVKHVEGGTKLIPVVLDDCRVPECLASTLWEGFQIRPPMTKASRDSSPPSPVFETSRPWVTCQATSAPPRSRFKGSRLSTTWC